MPKKEKIKTNDGTYVGEVKNGKPHGKGKLKMQGVDGAMDIYVGEFKNDKFHGKGTLTENVGGQYEGYQKNLKHIGIWKNGKSIKGKSIYQDGTKYEGDWSDENLAQGYGKITYPDGGKFVGKFYYDEPVKGEGVIHWNDAKYVGEMRTKDGSCDSHGEGIMIYKNGDRFEGKFKDGRAWKATKFVFYESEKKIIKHMYQGDMAIEGPFGFNGKGVLRVWDKSTKGWYRYDEGKFNKVELSGKGMRIYYYDKKLTRPRFIYKGEFKNGHFHGKGIAWYSNDNFYLEGIFKNGDYPKNKRKKVSKKIYNLFLYAKSIN